MAREVAESCKTGQLPVRIGTRSVSGTDCVARSYGRPNATANLRSTSVIAQFVAAQQGRALAILPCFLAAQDPRLLPVLADEVNITRQFWMYCREDLRKLKRITLLWDYIRDVTERNQALLMGETRNMVFHD